MNAPDPNTSRPLSGAKAWIITDGKAGMVVQARGVADALGLDYEMKDVHPTGIWRVLAPWGPVNPAERLGEQGSEFAPPWPQIVIATGRASIPYIRAIRGKAGPATYTVVLQDPNTGANIPAHHITQLTFSSNGEPVMVVNCSTAVSRDPFFSFNYSGAKAGDTLTVSWVDNTGESDQTEVVLS